MGVDKDFSLEIPDTPHFVGIGVSHKTASCGLGVDFAVWLLALFGNVDVDDAAKGFQSSQIGERELPLMPFLIRDLVVDGFAG